MDASQYNSLPGMFFEQAKERNKRLFLSHKEDSNWSKKRTWRASADEVTSLAAGLKHLGVKPGERVVICSENRPEWVIMDLAIMAIGAIAVPAYTTNTESDHSHILNDSEAVAALVSTRALAKRMMPAALKSPDCKFLVSIEPILIQQKLEIDVHAYDAVRAAGKDLKQKLDEDLAKLSPDDTANII